jgi:hypothetical protein
MWITRMDRCCFGVGFEGTLERGDMVKNKDGGYTDPTVNRVMQKKHNLFRWFLTW